MLTVWTKHLKADKDREQFSEYVYKCKPLLDRLMELLKEEEDNLNLSETSLRQYENPNWDYRQAHMNGYRSSLNFMKQLITLDRREKK